MGRAMGAAIHLAAGFVAVSDDAAPAMRALGRKHMDGALKAVKIMRNAIAHDLDWFVVFVPAAFATVCAGMECVFWIRREFWFQDTRRLFFLMSLDHGTSSPRNAGSVSGNALCRPRGCG